DDRIRGLLQKFLIRNGFYATAARDAAHARRILSGLDFDLIILDVMMPGEDGLSVCRRISAHNGPPIILVTARGEDIDRIIGLEIGADDYLPKPFHPRELIARARAVLRRVTATADPGARRPGEIYDFAGWTLDAAARALADPSGAAVELSAGDYDLLLALVTHPQRVLTREFLMDWTKGRDATPFDRSVDVALSRLRRKLGDDPAAPSLIRTVRNGGYLFAATVKRR
ncbi:MAG: response regulator, partial [Alphaproteobacteria bacterium]